jgi:hypothetical protein
MTVGRHWPKSRLGQHASVCSYCGATWPSGDLRRDRSGNWACPDEGGGADATTCNELNAAGARGANRRRRPMIAPVAETTNEPALPTLAIYLENVP